MSADQDPFSDYGYDLAHELTIALRLPMRHHHTTVSVPDQVLAREHDLDVDSSGERPAEV